MVQISDNMQHFSNMEDLVGYHVQLENFEGPLDLLLHLIKSDELEIWEISISRITNQYLEYLELMQAMNVEVAGDFLVMAATLMRMKSQKLLPRPVLADEDGEIPLTEEELIQRLIVYKIYKEAAATLKSREEVAGPRFPRGYAPRLPDDYKYPLQEVTLFSLVKALQQMEHKDHVAPAVHEVQMEDIRLEDQVAHVLSRLEQRQGRLKFTTLLTDDCRRLEVAVTFLAVLELARQQVVSMVQDQPFEDIWVVSREYEGAVSL
jgi:segregation and condensation protein A